MPEWLLQKDIYEPSKEKNDFIKKSTLSILKILTKIKIDDSKKKNLFGINALIKLIFGFTIIVLVALSKNYIYVLSIGIFLFFLISLLKIQDIKYIFKVIISMAFFTAIVLIPSIVMGNKNNSYILILKIIISIGCVNLISCTTKWRELIAAFKIVHLPDIIIFAFNISIKYIDILGRLALNMLSALKLRAIGKSKSKSSAISGIIGTMFIKSVELSEETMDAMECRGFNGEFKINSKLTFGIKDGIVVVLIFLMLIGYIFS